MFKQIDFLNLVYFALCLDCYLLQRFCISKKFSGNNEPREFIISGSFGLSQSDIMLWIVAKRFSWGAAVD